MVGNMKHGFDLLMKSLLFSKTISKVPRSFLDGPWKMTQFS
jgi:hypothetical protein